MKTETRHIILAGKIDNLLRKGLVLNQDILHYIDSTLLNPSVKDLESILNDPSDPESDALIELIFFPDERFQVQIETILEKENFHSDDEEKIACLLIEKKSETILIFPDKRMPLKFAMPDQAAYQSVSRLNVSKQLDPNIIKAINRDVPPEYRDLVKVKLRNSKFNLTKRRIFFICSFFEKIRVKDPVFLQCLNFILNFLDEIDDHENILSALLGKKHDYQQNIRQAEHFKKQRAGKNMELLILQGIRVPHINKEEALRNIELIDRISLAVFGQTGYPESDYSDFDFGSFYGKKDIGRLIKILS